MIQTPSAEVYVLDAWSILEWLQRKAPATDVVDDLFHSSLRGEIRLLLSRMNYGEVLYTCARRFPEDLSARIIADLQTFPIDVISVDDDLVDAAVAIKIKATASYADCFAAALAKRNDAAVVTGDDDFKLLAVSHGIKLRWVGK